MTVQQAVDGCICFTLVMVFLLSLQNYKDITALDAELDAMLERQDAQADHITETSKLMANKLDKPEKAQPIDEVKLPKENNYYKGEYQEEIK